MQNSEGFVNKKLLKAFVEGRYDKFLLLRGAAFVFILDEFVEKKGEHVFVRSNLDTSAAKLTIMADAVMGISTDANVAGNKREALRAAFHEVIKEAQSKQGVSA